MALGDTSWESSVLSAARVIAKGRNAFPLRSIDRARSAASSLTTSSSSCTRLVTVTSLSYGPQNTRITCKHRSASPAVLVSFILLFYGATNAFLEIH